MDLWPLWPWWTIEQRPNRQLYAHFGLLLNKHQRQSTELWQFKFCLKPASSFDQYYERRCFCCCCCFFAPFLATSCCIRHLWLGFVAYFFCAFFCQFGSDRTCRRLPEWITPIHTMICLQVHIFFRLASSKKKSDSFFNDCIKRYENESNYCMKLWFVVAAAIIPFISMLFVLILRKQNSRVLLILRYNEWFWMKWA